MQHALYSAIPGASLAVFPVMGGKPHQGVPSHNPALYPGHEVCNFTVLLGMRGQAELNRVRSRCSGEQYDPTLGLYYLRARYYNPLTGRFMSRDTNAGQITIPATLHKYLYAGGDPVDGVDPTGRGSILETGSLDLTIDEPAFPALREFGTTSVRIVCGAILTAAKYVPKGSGPFMTDLSLIPALASFCVGLGYY